MRFRFGGWSARIFAVGAFLVPCGLALMWVVHLSPPPKFERLQRLEGKVASARLRRANQARSYYEFELVYGAELAHVQVPDLGDACPGLQTLAPGQAVEIWGDLAGGLAGPKVYWAWQIRRPPETILSYEDRVKSYEGSNRRIGWLARGMVSAGLAMAIASGFGAALAGRSGAPL